MTVTYTGFPIPGEPSLQYGGMEERKKNKPTKFYKHTENKPERLYKHREKKSERMHEHSMNYPDRWFGHNEINTKHGKHTPYNVPQWQHRSQFRGIEGEFRETRVAEFGFADYDRDCRRPFKRITYKHDENCTTSPVNTLTVEEVAAPERERYLRFTDKKVSKYKNELRGDKASTSARDRDLLHKQDFQRGRNLMPKQDFERDRDLMRKQHFERNRGLMRKQSFERDRDLSYKQEFECRSNCSDLQEERYSDTCLLNYENQCRGSANAKQRYHERQMHKPGFTGSKPGHAMQDCKMMQDDVQRQEVATAENKAMDSKVFVTVRDMKTREGLLAMSTSFNGREVIAFVDELTGVNLIGSKFLYSLGYKQEQVCKTNTILRGISDKIIQPLGEVCLIIKVFELDIVAKFIVVDHEDFPGDILLSYDFLRKHISLDLGDSSSEMSDEANSAQRMERGDSCPEGLQNSRQDVHQCSVETGTEDVDETEYFSRLASIIYFNLLPENENGCTNEISSHSQDEKNCGGLPETEDGCTNESSSHSQDEKNCGGLPGTEDNESFYPLCHNKAEYLNMKEDEECLPDSYMRKIKDSGTFSQHTQREVTHEVSQGEKNCQAREYNDIICENYFDQEEEFFTDSYDEPSDSPVNVLTLGTWDGEYEEFYGLFSQKQPEQRSLQKNEFEIDKALDIGVVMSDRITQPIHVKRAAVLKPGEVVKVRCQVNAADSSEMFVFSDNLKISGLGVTDSLVTVNKQCFSLFLTNNCALTKRLQEGQYLLDGELYPLELAIIGDGQEKLVSSIVLDSQADKRRVRQGLRKTDYPLEEVKLLDLLMKYRNSVALEDEQGGCTDLIKHVIRLTDDARIKYIPAYRLPHSKREALSKIVDNMLENGIIEESFSPWNFPIILVPKGDSTFRPVVDYRELNKFTVPDRFPMPILSEVLLNLGNAKYFSSIDLKSGFWQIPLADETKELTAFSTPEGHFQFKVMPFGLRNAPVTFSRLMGYVFRNLKGVQIYLDDIIVATSTLEEHFQLLEEVLHRLGASGLKLRLMKCKFLSRELRFLGHLVSEKGISTLPDKTEKIRDYPIPVNKKQLLRFLGMAGYYRPFIKDYAKLSEPLCRLTRQSEEYFWGPDQERSFNMLKTALTTAPILSFPDYSKEFVVATDASDVGIGGVLMQKGTLRHMPIAYASRILNNAERNYSVTEREALAVVWTLKKFRDIILGYRVKVLTDHAPVTSLFKNRNLHGKLARWFTTLQEFEPSIAHIPGKYNTIADALSRLEEPSAGCIFVLQTVDLDMELVKVEQAKDEFFGGILKTLNETSQSEGIPGNKDYELLEDILYKVRDADLGNKYCLCIPASLVKRLLFLLHDHPLSGHPGRERMTCMARQNYFWKGMAKDIKTYIDKCESCLMHKGHTGKREPLELYPSALEPWELCSMDFMGPFPVTEKGNRFLLVFIDYLSRYVELVSRPNREAVGVAEALRDNIICRHSCPRILISDNAPEFVGSVLTKLCQFYHIKKVATTPYHPSSNGLVERANRKILDCLRHVLTPYTVNWDLAISDTQYAINATVNLSTGETPHFILHGYEKRHPTDVMGKINKTPPMYTYDDYVSMRTQMSRRIINEVRHRLLQESINRKLIYDRVARAKDVRLGQKVFVRRHIKEGPLFKLSSKFTGPYRVIEIMGKGKIKIKCLATMKESVVHLDHVKLVQKDVDPWFDDGCSAKDDQAHAQVPQLDTQQDVQCQDGPVASRTRSHRFRDSS